jgi:hypothetical protein
MPGNQRTTVNNTVLRNIISNNTNRSNVATNVNTTASKDKIITFYSYLKQFKDKGELVKFTKLLIEEFNYIPLKLDLESRIEVNLVRDIDWKIPLTII